MPSSKARLQLINDNPIAYMRDLVPDGSLQRIKSAIERRNELKNQIELVFVLAKNLNEGDLKACLDLLQDTSFADYKNSSTGWSRAQKRKELRLPDLRYVLLRQSQDGLISGFMSFMLTFEDGYEVVYLYEIHLRPELQGLGVGKEMIATLESAGKYAEVNKAMLTVFKANEKALHFYEKLGYEEDDFSPRPKRLRNGIVKEADYIILSKEM